MLCAGTESDVLAGQALCQKGDISALEHQWPLLCDTSCIFLSPGLLRAVEC